MSWEVRTMQSKTSYFNVTLFRKNLARFWPLWGGASALGALVPLAMLVEIIQRGAWKVQHPLATTAALYTALCTVVPVISLFFAVLCALAVWSYLFNARGVSLMHTLPITRKGLFLTNILSGLAMMLIPYAVTGGLLILLSLLVGAFEPVGILVTVLGVLGISFFYFATATFAAFCTGNMFAMPVLYGVFHCLAYALEYLLTFFTSLFYYGTIGYPQDFTRILTPTFYLVSSLQVDTTSVEVMTPGGYTTMELSSVTLLGGGAIVLYTLVGAALLAGCWLLYRSRRSESAGDVVAVGWMKPLFRYGVAFCAGISGGMGLYALLWSGFQKGARADVVPMLICTALVGVIGYYIASMLLAKSLRVLKAAWKGAAATAAAAAVLCVAVSLDPLGVETRLPAAGDIQEAYVNVSGNGYCSGNVSDPAAIQAILDAHAVLLSEREDLQARDTGRSWYDAEAYDDMAYVRMTYYLADGKHLMREYGFPYAFAETERSGSTIAALAELVTRPEIQRANIFETYDYHREIAKGSIKITSGRINDLYDPETGDRTELSLTEAQANDLYEAIVRDVEAGHFGRTIFEENSATSYYTDFLLYYAYDREDERGGSYTSTYSISLRFSTYCTEILRALEGMGVLEGGYQMLTEAEWNYMQEKRDHPYYYEEVPDAYNTVYPHEIVEASTMPPIETAIGGGNGPAAMLVTGG